MENLLADQLNALPAWGQTATGLILLMVTCLAVNILVKHVIVRLFMHVIDSLSLPLSSEDIDPTVRRLANVMPAVVISYGINLVPHLPADITKLITSIVLAFIVLTIARAISAALNLLNNMYVRFGDAATRPIKGYVQVVKILIYAAATVLIIAILMDQSPILLLSGLGAMAAVLMLVFKDTILSLVASVQLASNDMLRVGDWIEMPQLHADGDVIDIALHTVKVQNWDKTITSIPTYRLISDSYKNWRGMRESGGRRIKRPIRLDQTSVQFLTPEQIHNLSKFSVLKPYLEKKRTEIEDWNSDLSHSGHDPVNHRAMTNIGTFRAYVQAYLREHPRVNQDMTQLVRLMEPTGDGLPLEIYCFSNTVVWAEYEAIQSDIFDHLISILPYFGLRLFQNPTGADMQGLTSSLRSGDQLLAG